ncbi:MAG: TonB family protein [Chitinivibrionales bacterium]|nr:TonB family protein [Chitinivibrionales bacterium]
MNIPPNLNISFPALAPISAGPERQSVNPIAGLAVSLFLHIAILGIFFFLYHRFYQPIIYEPVKAFSLVSFPAAATPTKSLPAAPLKQTSPQTKAAPQKVIPTAEKTALPAQEKAIAPAAPAQAAPDSLMSTSAAQNTGQAPSGPAPGANPAGYDESNVVPSYKPNPAYPLIARQLGIEGKFVAILTVKEDGAVEKVDVLESPHPSFTRAAQETLRQWRYTINRKSSFGNNARYKKRVEITFRLNDEEQ